LQEGALICDIENDWAFIGYSPLGTEYRVWTLGVRTLDLLSVGMEKDFT
jgi:hypothetical protein